MSLGGFGLLQASAHATPAEAPHILVDVKSGKVLHHKNAFKRWSPASLTKLMTSYVTFRAIKAGELTLQSPVIQSQNSISEPPSKMGYKVGTILSVDNALNIILVKSANDISVALGEAVAGSEAAFVALMNQEARRLGMSGTNFENPHGLHKANQYTTARDMALLTLAIKREFPEHGWRFKIEALQSGKKTLRSFNVLLGRFKGADGMKTGYVCVAGFNLVSSATRGRRSVLSVVMGATSQNQRAELSANLLAAGFKKRSGTRIDRFKPYGADRNVMANMRPHICSSAAQRARTALRDEKGRLKISSPHVGAMAGAPTKVRVRTGDAGGPISKRAQLTSVGKLIASKRGVSTNTLVAAKPRFRPDEANGSLASQSNVVASAHTSASSLASRLDGPQAPIIPVARLASSTNNTGSLVSPIDTPSSALNRPVSGPPRLAAIPRFRPN